jgi:hypothetical protein
LALSDIFREVEEDVRKEKLEKFWKAYGDYIIALVALVILGIAGFELWQRYEANQRNKAAIAFSAAQRITDPRRAADTFADLAKTAPTGYRLLARNRGGALQGNRQRRQRRHWCGGAVARGLGDCGHHKPRRASDPARSARDAVQRLEADGRRNPRL